LANRKYCSKRCARLSPGQHLNSFTCMYCDKIFRKYPSQRRGKLIFCSKKCFDLYQGSLTKEQIIGRVQDLAKKIGHVPTIEDLIENSFPLGQIRKLGTFNNLLREADFPLNLEQNIPSRIKSLTKWQRAYIACAIDGEGSITKRTEDNGFRVHIANTHLGFLENIRKMTRGGRIMINRREQPRQKHCYSLYFRRREILDLLPQLLPYLIIKKDIAKLILEKYGE